MNQAYSSMTQQMLQAFQGQNLETAERLAKMILGMSPRDLVALQIYGLSLAMQGRTAEAIPSLYKATQQDQKNPELLSNLAKAQYGAELYPEAIETFKKLDRLIPNNPQILTDMGTSFAKANFFKNAGDCYEKAIRIDPTYFLAWSNQGNLLAKLGNFAKALVSYEHSLGLNPEYAETWTNYGNTLFDLERLQESKLAHERALSLNPNYAEAWSNYGNTLLELKHPEGFSAHHKAYSLNPDHPFLIGQLFNSAANACDWSTTQLLLPSLISKSSKGLRATHPFNLLQTNASLKLQRMCAETYVTGNLIFSNSISVPQRKYADMGGKIRIGYFSSDFKEHPVGILIENILRLHDHSRFEIFGFFLNNKTNDDREKLLVSLFDQSFNIFGLNNKEALDLIRAQELDIAIDLNGHTAGARNAIFAEKVAPVQVNYLGYAGTSGSNYYDALIADRVVIPLEDQMYFSEKIEYMPNSFFPVDTSISIESLGDAPSRISQGLPESGFIFTCFNNSYKITPEIFDIWMAILKKIPNSVLWLSRPSAKAIENLKTEAMSRGVDSSRLVFASRTPGRKEHLSRLRLADLFLDTLNYNAHATAADALWVGVPLLTLIGETFASRVAASQVNALGLSELIVHSEQDYFEKAVELARNSELLRSIRAQLEVNRTSSTLFDSKKYVKDLECLYKVLLSKAN